MREVAGADRMLAIGLAALAGYVDALGFLRIGGLFVAFMSGNSTQLAVELADGGGWRTMTAGLLLAFVAGVMAATVVAERLGSWAPPATILLTAALLAWAALLMVDGVGAILLAAAMGADAAKTLAEAVLARGEAGRTRRTLSLGTAGLAVRPGDGVRVEGEAGLWRVSATECERGATAVELVAARPGTMPAASVVKISRAWSVTALTTTCFDVAITWTAPCPTGMRSAPT